MPQMRITVLTTYLNTVHPVRKILNVFNGVIIDGLVETLAPAARVKFSLRHK